MEFTYEHTGKFLFHAHKVEFSEKGWVGVFLVKDSVPGDDGDYNGDDSDGYAATGGSSGAAGEPARDVTGSAAAYDGREAPDGA